MIITEKLDELLEKATKDADLRKKLLATRTSANPLADFCTIASDNGFPMSVMDIVNQGEDTSKEISQFSYACCCCPVKYKIKQNLDCCYHDTIDRSHQEPTYDHRQFRKVEFNKCRSKWN